MSDEPYSLEEMAKAMEDAMGIAQQQVQAMYQQVMHQMSAFAGAWEQPMLPEPEPVVEQIPILANRFAHLMSRDGKVTLASCTFPDKPFGIMAEAECCMVSMDHAAPDYNCQCGFYAVPADQMPRHVMDYGYSYADRPAVRLQVELSGKVIEHDRGYRAQHQRVIEVMLPNLCLCGRQATTTWVYRGSSWSPEFTCGSCGPRWRLRIGHDLLTDDDLSAALGVPIVRGDVQAM